MTFATTQPQARNAFTSAYAFELRNGGLGVALTAGSASTRATLPEQGGNLTVFNAGTAPIWFRIGDSNVVATTGCTPIAAGIKEVFTIMADDTLGLANGYTHIAVIAQSGAQLVTANRGYGI